MNKNFIVQLNNLSKIYNDRVILKNLNISFLPGSFSLLIGANGSGKSTLLRLIANMTKPTKGKILRNFSDQPGFIGHEKLCYSHLSAFENLLFWNKISQTNKSDKDILEALHVLKLGTSADEPTAFFSRGMIQKLHFARILLTNSRLILLDEPFTGLDKETEILARNIIINKHKTGACIILVSHFPERDAEMAERILQLENGKINILSPYPKRDV